jgi:preprotein translocase subunit SecA
MGQIYSALGLSVGAIGSNTSFIYDETETGKDEERDEAGSYKIVHEFLKQCTRKEAYEADVTYGTNSEFGFDYLRDNIEYEEKSLRQRVPHFAVVDEIDSILIDEARTPLIISAPSRDTENLYDTFTGVARQLKQEEHFTVDEKVKAVSLTDAGIEKAENILGIENIYTEHGIKYVHHLELAVRAKALFERDKEYVVKEGEVIIVDEFTGRLQPGRRWSEGLHQAIESKEGVKIQQESRTFASITYQNYFRMYEKLSGMTGTAMTSSEEFYKVYGLETVAIPTNIDPKRIDQEDLIFQTETGKFKAVARKVKELNDKGQPVLIGTASIEKNELLSAFLKREGIGHELLNAKNHEREGEIIAGAGAKGKVTIATNMAGRGVDIKLGGPEGDKEKAKEIKELGGLFVLGTERHEARRIDNQLRGRSGRQGDEGETQFFVSLEDDLMRVFASDTIKNMMGRFGIPEDEPIENRMITRSLESAQTKIEGFNFDSRKHVLSFDDVINQQRQTIYERRRAVLCGSDEKIEELLDEIILLDKNIADVIKEKKESLGEEEFMKVARRIMLQTTDMLWVEHLEMMDYLRSSVNLRAYGQRDPLTEYRKEGLKLFKELEEAYAENVLKMIPNIDTGSFKQDTANLREVHRQAKLIGGNTTGSSGVSIKNSKEKVGRNDPCPCGSGKKYKKCGLIGASEHKG